jgi:toxin ParE1/3/4
MPYNLRLTESAEHDLEDIYSYISSHDSIEKAIYVIGKIEARIMQLKRSPERGSAVRELSLLGIHEYREIFFKPYRIIYKVIVKTVYIMIIADGRRDMQTLLQRRLLK